MTDQSHRRGKDGRFIGKRSNAEIGDTEGHTNRCRKKRKDLQRVLFEGFISVFFLVGTSDDYIPFSSNGGPLVETYESIVKSSYLLGRRNRSDIVQSIYKGDELRGVSAGISRPTLNSTKASSSCLRRKVYKFRRLPSISKQTSEIQPLKAWIRSLQESKALACSFDEAFAICCKAIGSCRIIKGKRIYVGFHFEKGEGNVSATDSIAFTSQENRDPNIVGGQRAAPRDSVNYDVLDLVQSEYITERTSNSGPPSLERNSTNSSSAVRIRGPTSPRLVTQSSNDKFLFQLNEFHDYACDETNYRILCMLFDERLETKFHFVAGSFLEKHKNGGLKIPIVLRQILLHSHEKAFGVRDKDEYLKRERSLLTLKKNVERLREIVGLRTYDEICWTERARWVSGE